MFTKYTLPFESNLYNRLSTTTEFEDVMKGRKGAIIVDTTNDGAVPIIRTTTRYLKAAQHFKDIHHEIVDNLRKVSNISDLKLNNAMVEIYDSRYRKMGWHSDQALDLDPNSYICIFSCYNTDKPNDVRKLKVKGKGTNECFDISLTHNSCVLFPVSINSHYLHKIILERVTSDDVWLGITFRLSKTYVKFVDGKPYFVNGRPLYFASDKEQKEFFKSRGQENRSIDFMYSEIEYTISESDLMKLI